ncbi:MAG TPA: amino acid adenylation domain-containing protein, partial [Polyangia bacterium]
QYDYRALGDFAGRVAAWLRTLGAPGRELVVGVLAARSLDALGGILGTLWAGATYVPLSTKLPDERLATLLARVPLDAVIVDGNGMASLTPRVRSLLPGAMLSPSQDAAFAASTPLAEPVPVDGERAAYLLFTSGTTGVPKAVEVTVANVAAYLRGINGLYRFTPGDRVSQFAEISFDFSVHEMLVAWGAGASLWVVPENQRLAPHQFIRENAITVWSSVPSVVSMLQRLKLLRPASFPSLRLTLFSGDALPAPAAQAWQAAAPSSRIDNHFGATELTVMCTHASYSGPDCADARGMVPVGVAYPEMRAAVIAEDGSFAARGVAGELAFSGPQVTAGYRGEPELTARRFPRKQHAEWGDTRWYLTGDLAVEDANGTLHHLGRVDNQVKVRGYRIELEDVESHLREVSGCELVCVLAWPLEAGTATGLVAFVTACGKSESALKEALQARLPSYMVPKEVRSIDELPLSDHGKVDRKRLRQLLATST